MKRIFYLLVTFGALCAIALSLVQLGAARSGISITHVQLGPTPATFYQSDADSDLLVVVSHGFAGSRQMMEGISLSLAKAGHDVVAFDYQGHGRHPGLLSPNVTTLTGTTEDLVLQTLNVVEAARERTRHQRLALVGHSMATDVIIRAADRLDAVAAVMAISMYSESVTPTHPERLLILSGAQETRLRAVALSALGQLGGSEEGVTVTQNGIERRAAVAPLVGHVGVLWSPVTSAELLGWLGSQTAPVVTGPWIAALLGGVLALFWPIARLLPHGPDPAAPSLRRALLSVALPVPFAVLGSFIDLPLLGLSGFGALWLFFVIWGAVGLAVLRPRFPRKAGPAFVSAGLIVLWGLGAFALALDQFGAAFLPVGSRLTLMAVLLPATLVFALADRVCVQGRHWLMRLALRLPVVLALLTAMVLNVADMGLLFTVLPVLVLFLAVYGTMARWAERRAGLIGPALGSGVILAWSIAASTPLFAMP